MKRLFIFSSKSPWRFLFLVFLFALVVIVVVSLLYFYYKNETTKNENTDLVNRPFSEAEDLKFDVYEKDICENWMIDFLPDTIDDDDVWVIGDSFTVQGEGGFNNCLAHAMNKGTVWTVVVPDPDPLQTFVELCYRRNTMPKVCIVESVERSFVKRLLNLSFEDVYQKEESDVTMVVKNGTIFEQKIRSLYEYIGWPRELYRKWKYTWHEIRKSAGLEHGAGYYKLSRPFFSNPGHEFDLNYLMGEDQSDIIHFSDNDLMQAKCVLDSLYSYASNFNVALYFVVIPDKYDVYQEYIIDKSHPVSDNLDRFACFYPGNECFVNAKDYIIDEVHAGEKDVYYCYDSHWTPKAARIVGDSLASLIVKTKKQ